MPGPSNSVDINSFLAALLGSLGGGQQGGDFSQQFLRMLDPAFAKEAKPGPGENINLPAVTSGGRALGLQNATKEQPSIQLVDVRTPQIAALETAGLFPMIQSLLNPQWLANNVTSQTGAAPQRGAANVGLEGAGGLANPLMQMLFSGQAGGTQTPWNLPGRGGQPAGPTVPTGGGAGAPGGPVAPPAGGGGQTPPLTNPTAPGALPGGNPPTSLPANPTTNPQGAPNPPGTSLDSAGVDLSALFQQLIGQRDAQMWNAGGQAVTDPTQATSVADPSAPPPLAGGSEELRQRLLAMQANLNPGSSPINWAAYGFPEPQVDARAAGGQLNPQNMTVVGEAGPELIVPTPQGQQVVPMMGPNVGQQIMQLLSQGAQGMQTGGVLPEPIFDQTIVNSQAPLGGQPLIQPPTDPAGGGQIAGGLNLDPNLGQFSGSNQPGALGQAAAFNPELDAFNALKTAIGGGWGGQANTAFNLGQGMLGDTQGIVGDTRSLASGSFVTPEIQNSLTGQLNTNPGQGVMDALRPVWEQNLQGAFGQLQASSPSVFNSAQQLAGTDLARSSLNDFNLMAAQAMQQGVGQQQNAASILGQLLGQNKSLNMQGLGQAGQLGQGNAAALGQLGQGAAGADMSALQTLLGGAGQAGQGQFGRLNQAAQTGMAQQGQGEQSRQFNLQYDQAAQNQAYQQQMNPTLQLLLAAMGLAEPTGLQTVVGSQKAS